MLTEHGLCDPSNGSGDYAKIGDVRLRAIVVPKTDGAQAGDGLARLD